MANFKPKVNEPQLSLKMKNIVSATRYEGLEPPYDTLAKTKSKILDLLSSNGDILRTLHNKELEPKVPTLYLPEYMNDSEKDREHNGYAYIDNAIYNYLRIPELQDEVKVYLCFEVNDITLPNYNENLMTRHIIFRPVCYKTETSTDYGIKRQDLLAMIIKEEFDWSNVFGPHTVLVSDQGSLSESSFYYRELVYQTTVPNDHFSKINNNKYNNV